MDLKRTEVSVFRLKYMVQVHMPETPQKVSEINV